MRFSGRRRIRVALGPIDVAGLATMLGDQLAALGADVEVVLSQTSFAFPRHRLVRGRVARTLYGLRAGVRRDVLHFHFGVSWAPFNVDAAWARLWRRTLVASYFGDDCRLAAVATARFAARGRVTDPARDNAVRRRLARLGRLCHAAIAADMELATYLRPYFDRIYLVPVPVRPPGPDAAGAARDFDKPLVVHIPSDPAVKGTQRIQQAVEAVARRVPLEFRLLPRVLHDQAMRELARADLVIDQLNSVTTGVLALEAMQLGLPVLGEIDRRALAPFQEDSPVVPVTPESLETELESLVRDPERRAELGERGRAFVARVHAARKVAEAVLQVYGHASSARPGLYEANAEAVNSLDWPR